MRGPLRQLSYDKDGQETGHLGTKTQDMTHAVDLGK